MKASSFQPTALCILTISLLLCSCKENQALFKEKADLDISLRKAREELSFFETQIGALGQPIHLARADMETKTKTADTTNLELTQKVSDLSVRADRLDAANKQLRPRFEAYKKKYMR